MKFDLVIGNPPYRRGADLDFVNISWSLSCKYVVMITPAKWQTAPSNQLIASTTLNYGQFRDKFVPHMREVVFYPDCKDVFNILQADGITYYVMDKNEHKTVTVRNICSTNKSLNSISYNRVITGQRSLINIGDEIVSSLGEYEIFKPSKTPKNKRYQVFTNSKVPGGGFSALSKTNSKGYYLGLSRILDSMSESDMQSKVVDSACMFSSDSIDECKSLVSWLNTRFTRFFLAINISKLTGLVSDDCFRFVPMPPSKKFDHIYTDSELYSYFKLTKEYIDVINSIVKERI